MRRLRHTVPLGTGETPASFASRVAAFNGLPAREFCLDMGTCFQAVVDGDTVALRTLAAVAGADPASLAENAFVRIGEQLHRHRGQDLKRRDLRRMTVAVCPKCLAENLAAAPGRRPGTVVFQRASWQIAALKTCPIHLAPLVMAEKDATPQTLHDWAYHVENILPRVTGLAAGAATRALTTFETYLVDRIDGRSPQGGPIDEFPLFVAIAACELFGAVATLGRMPNLKRLTDDEWRLAGAAGFDIFAAGQPGVEAFLAGLQATYPYNRCGTEGPQAVFGRIYQVLEFGRADPAFDALRDLVGAYIRNHFPLAAGDLVFGIPTPARTLHSIRSLSLETGQHPKRLRKLLEASGTISAASRLLVDANVVFPALAASLACLNGSTTLSLPAAGRHLNAPRCQIRLLATGELIRPVVDGRTAGAVDQFAIADLDAFLERLLDGAEPVRRAKPGQVDIPSAAKRACCSAAVIVQLILDKKLAWTGRSASARGYLSALVDVDEVRRLVVGDDHGGIKPRDVAKLLGVSDKVVYALIQHGHLPSVSRINPVNRCPQTVVMPADLEAFQQKYVTLFRLAKERGEHFQKTKKALNEKEISPVFEVNTTGASFFYRALLERKNIIA